MSSESDRFKALNEIINRAKKYNNLVTDDLDYNISGTDNVIGKQTNKKVEALGKLFMDTKGISSPKKVTEEFISDIISSNYPELGDKLKGIEVNPKQGYSGYYDSKNKIIGVDKNNTLEKIVGTALHEGGHSYDDLILGSKQSSPVKEVTKDKMKALQELLKVPVKNQADYSAGLKKILPSEASEITRIGHHLDIPDLRDQGSYEKNALLKLAKNIPFKSIMPLLPVAGAALSTADALASIEGVGEGSDDRMLIEGENLKYDPMAEYNSSAMDSRLVSDTKDMFKGLDKFNKLKTRVKSN